VGTGKEVKKIRRGEEGPGDTEGEGKEKIAVTKEKGRPS